jgi:hypothetical protein
MMPIDDRSISQQLCLIVALCDCSRILSYSRKGGALVDRTAEKTKEALRSTAYVNIKKKKLKKKKKKKKKKICVRHADDERGDTTRQ